MRYSTALLKIDVFCKIPKEALEKKWEKSREQQVPVDDSWGAVADLLAWKLLAMPVLYLFWG